MLIEFLVDPGSSIYFQAHRILFKSNVYALENVARLDLILKHMSNRQDPFFSFDVLPIKIQGGTGGPCRLVARIEQDDSRGGGWFIFLGVIILFFGIFSIFIKTIYDLNFNGEKITVERN